MLCYCPGKWDTSLYLNMCYVYWRRCCFRVSFPLFQDFQKTKNNDFFCFVFTFCFCIHLYTIQPHLCGRAFIICMGMHCFCQCLKLERCSCCWQLFHPPLHFGKPCHIIPPPIPIHNSMVSTLSLSSFHPPSTHRSQLFPLTELRLCGVTASEWNQWLCRQ